MGERHITQCTHKKRNKDNHGNGEDDDDDEDVIISKQHKKGLADTLILHFYPVISSLAAPSLNSLVNYAQGYMHPRPKIVLPHIYNDFSKF